MSASLVGSEMCIRDSLNSYWRLRVSPERHQARRQWSYIGHMRWRNSRGAVSYTHLTLPTICSV
eukprot:146811-Alexandrium_andersonii.AAC.1